MDYYTVACSRLVRVKSFSLIGPDSDVKEAFPVPPIFLEVKEKQTVARTEDLTTVDTPTL